MPSIEKHNEIKWPTDMDGHFFEMHIRESICVNKARKPLYSKLTNGKSEKLSNTFLRNQHFSLPIARFTDYLGKRYQKLGIPILELDLVSMHNIDKFKESSDQEPMPISAYTPIDVMQIRQELRKAYKDGGFEAVSTTAQNKIDDIAPIKTYHSMTKHMLESIVRMSNLGDIYIQMALDRGIKSPRKLSRFMLTLHMNAMIGCKTLDKLAAPFQADGIPIINQDVPAISPLPSTIDQYISRK